MDEEEEEEEEKDDEVCWSGLPCVCVCVCGQLMHLWTVVDFGWLLQSTVVEIEL